MNRWHRHLWTTTAENYTQPLRVTELKGGKVTGEEAVRLQLQWFERVAFGVTTVTQVCSHCGEQRSYTVTGDARSPSP